MNSFPNIGSVRPGAGIVKKLIIKKSIDNTSIICYNDYSKKKGNKTDEIQSIL